MKRFIALWIIVSFFASAVVVPRQGYAQEPLNLPLPGNMVSLSPAYVPVLVKGLKVHPENPLLFDFILDSGNSGLSVNSPEFKAESQKLIKYFLASLTIKEEDLWVNLSPYEKDRMIPHELGRTELGRDMLAQDYILKQLTASLIYPEKQLGKEFWNRIYAKARKMFGTANVPVNTFNKVWIVADRAKVLERHHAACKGLSVFHGDLDEGLADYADGSVDVVILAFSLQQLRRPRLVVREMVRVGKLAVVSFPNFAHWSTRAQLCLKGRMPVSSELPYQWYDTPNIHLCTVKDFRDLCRQEGLRIEHEFHLRRFDKPARDLRFANLGARIAVFAVTRLPAVG